MVHEGDILFELESDKATQEVESFDSGVLRLPADAAQPGDTVKVGQCLGFLCDADESVPNTCSSGDDVTSHSDNHEFIESSDQSASITHADSAHTGVGKELPDASVVDPPATPSARRLARKLGVEIRQASQAGNRHAVTQEDVLAAAKANEDSTHKECGNGLAENARIAVSPRAAARAAQLDISLAEITGTGRAECVNRFETPTIRI